MTRAAIVLCGGRSTRMGRDKASLAFGPEPMLSRVVRLLHTLVDRVVVVAAGGQQLPPLPPEAADKIVPARDEHPDRGPLEGLAAGLRALPPEIEAVYASSCDVPLLVPEFVARMFSLLGPRDEIAVPRQGRFHHPLAAVYRPGVLPRIEALLAADRLRPVFLFAECRTREVAPEQWRDIDPHDRSLMNCNRPEDYAAALRQAGFDPPPDWNESVE